MAACGRGDPAPSAPEPLPPKPPAPLAGSAAAEPPLRIAAFDEDGLHVATVAGNELRIKRYEKDGLDSVGWLDERTLVTSESTTAGVEVTHYVDDEPPRTIVLDDELFQTSGGSLTNVVFVGGEVWVARCIDREQDPCKAEAFVRASPGAHERVTQLPPGARRSADNFTVERASPTVAAPPDARVQISKRVEKLDDDTLRIKGVECAFGTQTSRYPTASLVEGERWIAKTVRWVHASPPIYEVVSIETGGGAGLTHVKWLQACDPEPFDAFAAFRDNLWAGLRYESGTDVGSWQLWRGSQRLGTLPGGSAIRANR